MRAGWADFVAAVNAMADLPAGACSGRIVRAEGARVERFFCLVKQEDYPLRQ
ncbi:MAG: hypothetical protein AB1671_18955 [Thermodesulfobacteriota bacterium]|jgi:hypothetical protein